MAVFYSILLCVLQVLIEPGALPAPPVKKEGLVTAIVDGDTFEMLIGKEKVRVRMNGIDAPERKQDFYNRSRQTLATLCFGKRVVIIQTGHDRYRRVLADVYLGSRQLNRSMVASGMAWHFRKYSKDPVLAGLERQARQKKLGLWSQPAPVAPWVFRESKKHSVK